MRGRAFRGRAIVAVAAALVLAAPAGAGAVALSVRTFSVGSSGCCFGIAAGPDDSLWVSETGHIARITTAGAVSQFAVQIPDSSYTAEPQGLAEGPDGNLWFADTQGGIGMITGAGSSEEYPFASVGDESLDGQIAPIAFAADGSLWTVATNAMGTSTMLLRTTVAEAPSSDAQTFPFPGDTVVTALARGPDGNIWFAQADPAGVGRSTATGQMTVYTAPFGAEDQISALTAGPDGNLWIVDNGPRGSPTTRIARMTPSGVVTWFPVPQDPGVTDSITTASDGNLWFISNDDPGAVARITPSGEIVEFALPAGSDPKQLVSGPDGNLWYFDSINSVVASFSPRPPCSVPRLIGLTRAQAARQVAASGFCTLGQISAGGAGAEVHIQRPAPGQAAPDGAAINLTLGAPSTLKIAVPHHVEIGVPFGFRLSGDPVGGGYTLFLAIGRQPCARDPQVEFEKGVPVQRTTVNHRFTVRFSHVLSPDRGVHYICTWLGLSSTLTTASARASYVTR